MEGFGLLIGHLLGDYIFQNDYLAANKAAWGADFFETWVGVSSVQIGGVDYPRGTKEFINAMEEDSHQQVKKTAHGHFSCTVHCLFYTFAVWLCSSWWMPWWGLTVCFAAHWPIDRFRLARFWMEEISGQKAFANGPLAPWSVIVVDNVFHLLTLFVIALIAGVR